MKAPRVRGFSLIEVLVAIAIMGIAVAAVSLTVAPGEGRKIDEEGERLAALFRLAQSEAQLSGRRLEWRADSWGYQFTTDGAPRKSVSSDALRARPWPFAVRSVDAPIVRFGYEPLFERTEIRVSTSAGTVKWILDPMGTLKRAP